MTDHAHDIDEPSQFEEERRGLEDTQVALLNILEDLQSVEQLHELDQLKERFIALASHELRTPLTSIAGLSSTLVALWDGMEDERRLELVRIIDSQAQRMTRLINDVLVLSRINAGALVVERIRSIVRDEIELAASQFREATFEVSCASDVHMFADPEHVQQALVNYLSNAIKYGATPLTIDVTVDGDWVDIMVCDQGPGVPTELRRHLFEEFAPSIHPQPTEQPGSGLGLSIVRRLIRAQGGDAWYEPNAPHGARFGLRLPYDP